tara:strand:+ start:547 stop:750 length:204 start_codon:yes stop_codon:yes gene_type:complete
MQKFNSKQELIEAKVRSSVEAVTHDGHVSSMEAVIRQETTAAERTCRMHTLPTPKYIIEGFGWSPVV